MIRTLSTILAGWLLVTYYGGTIAAQHADLSQRKACVPDRFAVEEMRQ